MRSITGLIKVVKGIGWRGVDANTALSANFSGAGGMQANVAGELQARGLLPGQNGTGCNA